MSVKTPDWAKDAVFYQIFPDRFAYSSRVFKPRNLQHWGAEPTYFGFQGGDLLGVAEKLDYLADLGVTALYLNPVFSSASNHRYHTYDYMTIDPLLGGDAAFKEMLQAAHDRGIRVVLDGVFNHASRGFFQFNHAMECGPESPYADWFHIHGWPINAFNTHQPPNYYAWWGLHALPKFNTSNPAVREYLWRVATYWLEMGIDGWRLDVPNEIDDDEFWREFRRRCLAVNPECYIVGELWHDSGRWLQGDQFDAQMNYVFARAAFGYFVGDEMDQSDTPRTGYGYIPTLNGYGFLNELARINHLYHPEIVMAQMNLLGSHDTPRLMTIARGNRVAVRLMYLCMLTYPGCANIYYGDEIGLTGGHDPYCRRAFPWHDEAGWDKTLRNVIKSYIKMRADYIALRRGTFTPLYSDQNVAVYARQYEGQTVIVAFNSGETDVKFKISWPEYAPEQLQEILVAQPETISAEDEIVLYGFSGRVWVGNL